MKFTRSVRWAGPAERPEAEEPAAQYIVVEYRSRNDFQTHARRMTHLNRTVWPLTVEHPAKASCPPET